MILAVDAGNSHIRLGGYEEDENIFFASIETCPGQTADYYACALQQLFSLHGAQQQNLLGAVISSVVPALTPVLAQAIALLSDCPQVIVSAGVKTGLNIRSEQPRHIGTDRVAAAVGALQKGKLPCVIVDLGTATAFTVLDDTGALITSAITAGVRLTAEALRQRAAQLPAVSLVEGEPVELLARSTEDAVRTGAVLGAASMVDGMIDRYRQTLGQLGAVYVTGGAAQLIAPYLRVAHQVESLLGLDGLIHIFHKNCG